MHDFKDISIIVHCRIDNEERGKNAALIYKFHKSNTENCQFIFVEDDIDNKLSKYINIDNTDIHIITENGGNWHKTKCYNIGARASTRPYFYFLDLDVIVGPDYIIQSIDQIMHNGSDLVIGYNGQSLYLTYNAKQAFSDNPTYSKLQQFIPHEWLFNGQLLNHNIQTVQDHRTNQTGSPLNIYEHCMAPNNKAIGGCVIANKASFFKYKGFNPNFIGWGYEDNEFPTRVHKLGYTVNRINCAEALLFHLPHDPEGGDSSKNAHKDHNRNHKEITKVESSTKEELKEYIKTWNV